MGNFIQVLGPKQVSQVWRNWYCFNVWRILHDGRVPQSDQSEAHELSKKINDKLVILYGQSRNCSIWIMIWYDDGASWAEKSMID